MNKPIRFFVFGVPKPGGSKRVFINKKTGKPIVVDDCKENKTWRNEVAFYARKEYTGPPLAGPIRLDVTFYFDRPKGHYGTGKNKGVLKASAPTFPICRPDRTKLLRSTEDALTDAGIWADDSQVVSGNVVKRYTSPDCVLSDTFYFDRLWAGISKEQGAYIDIAELK